MIGGFDTVLSGVLGRSDPGVGLDRAIADDRVEE